jgi:uncharacterized protein YndB with AHSA1/START domain
VSSIECDEFIARPPAAVWRALTEPDLMGRWWVRGDIKPVVGHRFTLDMGPWGIQWCEVLQVEPEKLLSYSFAEGELDTTISWRLEPEGDGTRLFLVHSGFAPDSVSLRGMSNGWPGILKRVTFAIP